jgi:hypothetical protein
MDRAAVRAARLAGVEPAAGSGHGCSPRGLLEEEEAEGNLTMGKRQRSGDGARPVASSKGGGGSVLDGEVIWMQRGEAKVWNGGGGRWPSRRCLL